MKSSLAPVRIYSAGEMRPFARGFALALVLGFFTYGLVQVLWPPPAKATIPQYTPSDLMDRMNRLGAEIKRLEAKVAKPQPCDCSCPAVPSAKLQK